MAPRKKYPGVYEKTQKDGTVKWATRPYNRATRKKGTEKLFDTALDAYQYKLEQEAKHADPSKAGWTVAKWAEEWTTNPGFDRPKESTNVHRKERIKAFVEEYGDLPMEDVSRSVARKFAGEYPARVNAVRAMFSDAFHDEIITANPFTRLRMKGTTGRKHLDVPTEKEIGDLIEIAYEKWPDWPFYGSYITVAAYTGVRIGELLALKWDDIDWAAGTLRVERAWNSKTRKVDTPKNGQVRIINLFEQAAEALRILPKDGPDGLIWRSPRGQRMEPNLHFYYWSQVRERWFGTLSQERYEKLKELDFHTLRHFHASWLVDMGVPPADVAAQLGHTDGGYLVQTLYGHLYSDNSLARIKKVYSDTRRAATTERRRAS